MARGFDSIGQKRKVHATGFKERNERVCFKAQTTQAPERPKEPCGQRRMKLRTRQELPRKQNGSPKAPDCLWWSEGDLNPRHADFQSAALPTELPDHIHQLRCELIVYRKARHRSSTNCSFMNAISHFTDNRRFEPHRRSSRGSFRFTPIQAIATPARWPCMRSD